MNLGAPELLIILLVILLIFGASRLPKLARSLGQSSKEFKKGISEGVKDDDAPGEPAQKAEPKAAPSED